MHEPHKNLNSSKDIDCGHGRIEERTCFATDKIDWLGELKFPGMKSIICIGANRTIGDSTSNERCHYISSLSADAGKLMQLLMIIGAWRIVCTGVLI
jgi:hypothetical protein